MLYLIMGILIIWALFSPSEEERLEQRVAKAISEEERIANAVRKELDKRNKS